MFSAILQLNCVYVYIYMYICVYLYIQNILGYHITKPLGAPPAIFTTIKGTAAEKCGPLSPDLQGGIL